MAEPDGEHLSQQEIPGIADILEELGLWLEGVSFEKKEKGVEKCADKGLPKAARVLFNNPEVHQKLSAKAVRYNVLRMRGKGTMHINIEGSVYLVPVKVWGETPTIKGLLLTPGTMMHVMKDVRVHIGDNTVIDLLIMAEK